MAGNTMVRVSGLFHYPIKSCRGLALDRAALDRRGIVDDRRLMLVDAAGRFLTQRELPRMALIEPRLGGEPTALSLSAPGMPALSLPMVRDGPRLEVGIWRDRCPAVDQGEAVAAWFGDFLGIRCRLVRIPDDHVRRVNPAFAVRDGDEVGFADGYPLLLIAEASLADLNARLPAPLPMARFRPNLVVTGCAPYAEDGWRRLRVGGIELAVVKPCPRCAIPTTDQQTAERGQEPLRTLATYRRLEPFGVVFGQNVIHRATGTLRIGDAVEVIE